MSRFLIKPLITTLLASLCLGATATAPGEKRKVAVALKEVFDHKKHLTAFADSVSCTDCHSFSVKTNVGDPLSAPVPKGLLAPDRQVCHLCHLHSIKRPTPNQCVLCHSDTKAIMPDSHKLNWNFRHGRVAQNSPESCRDCHQDNTCSKCHTQRDSLKPTVHRPNFRLTHGIEARARPESCATCHSTSNTCTQCHSKGAP